MKFFVIGFAVLTLASAGVLPVEYLPPVQQIAAPTVEYLPPAALEPTTLADDGYRYKTVRKLRLRHRHRRDVSELAHEYLPPVELSSDDIPVSVEEAVPVADSAILANDGYRYRTVKRYRIRRRRDVNEINSEYLPPVEESAAEIIAPAPESAVLADDGYRYRTVKRYRIRRRRDVNEINSEYLPPVEESAAEIIAPAIDSAVLADDGYRYKTVRKLRFRYRH